MLILATEMVTFEGKTFSGEARFDGVEKNQWLPILLKIAPTFFFLSLYICSCHTWDKKNLSSWY